MATSSESAFCVLLRLDERHERDLIVVNKDCKFFNRDTLSGAAKAIIRVNLFVSALILNVKRYTLPRYLRTRPIHGACRVQSIYVPERKPFHIRWTPVSPMKLSDKKSTVSKVIVKSPSRHLRRGLLEGGKQDEDGQREVFWNPFVHRLVWCTASYSAK